MLKKPPRSTILMPVFAPAVIVLVLLVIGTISNPDAAGELFNQVLTYTTTTFGWFYMLAVALFLIFILVLAFSSYGNIKLGPDHAEPDYKFSEWFAMLFSAGYGIALLFYGVSEPVVHFAEPPNSTPETIAAAKEAMQIAYFHWGLHTWAIYTFTGLVLAYFGFRHGLPLSMRSTLFPLIGDKIYGPIGHGVDVVALLATIFGVATTLGLSVSQINSGLNYLLPDLIPISTSVQIITIAIITLAALVSVLAGMDKGIKRLSMLNVVLATALMVFVFIAGPSVFILNAFMENTGSYLSNIVERTFSLQAYVHGDWIASWTLFIFAWTIAWSPFVGTFIANISRGRTIRQFVLGVLFVPVIFTFFWFAVFGDTALNLIMVQGLDTLIGDVQADKSVALFKLFEALPFTQIASYLTVLLIMTFFVTSSDSGSLVIDSIASGGRPTPAWQRTFWVVIQGVVASVLLLAGGLTALQTVAIVSALPFAIILLISMGGMWRALIIEEHRTDSLTQDNRLPPHLLQPSAWRERIDYLTKQPQRTEVLAYIREVVDPAMHKVADKFNDSGWKALVEYDEVNSRATLELHRGDDVEFWYEVRLDEHDIPEYYEDGKVGKSTPSQLHHYRAAVYLRRGGQTYDLYGYQSDAVINDIVDQFEKYLNFLEISPDSLPWRMEMHDEGLIVESTSEFDKER